MSKPPTTTDRPDPAIYEIRVKGHLDQRWSGELGVSVLAHDPDGTTILTAGAADQSALHGLLQRIRDLGLPLVSVNQTSLTPQIARTSK